MRATAERNADRSGIRVLAVERADAAMCAAKNGGRSGFCYHRAPRPESEGGA